AVRAAVSRGESGGEPHGDGRISGPLSATITSRDFAVKKHFTPAQIRAWFSPEAAARPDSLLAKLGAGLTVREMAALEAALLDVFAGSGTGWRQSYDFLRIEYKLADLNGGAPM
ncbi:MAG: hypothetical protein ABI036_18460, partial [Fibrobacteria bacterium]